LNSSIITKSKENQSIFLFSEITKNKMKEDDMNISSIDISQNIYSSQIQSNKKKTKRNYGFDQINKEKINQKLYNQFDNKKDNENHKENNENKKIIMEIKSDKDSLMSILSDLI